MQRNYNHIYSELVESETDLIGHIAYSLYKRHKVEYIDSQKAKGVDVTDEFLSTFHDISNSDSSLENYKTRAKIIIQGFMDNILEETINDIEARTNEEHKTMLAEIVKPLKPKFWNDVAVGIVSSIIVAGIVIIAAFLYQNKDVGFHINIVPNKPTTIKNP